MAESGVDFLLQSLGSAVQQEASLLQELSSIDEIQGELQCMRSFLKDADRRKNSDDGVKIWVGRVRQVAFEVEDIIDEYMNLSCACVDEANEDGGGGLLWRSLYKMIHLLKRYYYKRQIASKLQAVRCKISQVSGQSKLYNFQIEQGSTSKTTKNEYGENWQRSGEYLSSIPDDHFVGIEKNKDFLIRKLTDHEERPERTVLSVVGMGGLGKTTLVIKTFNSPKVKKHFHCHAWITVSQSYIFDEVLRSLIKELYKSSNDYVTDATLSKMNTGCLVQMVTNYLLEKRYVIVLDDVWESNFWKRIHVAFPNNGCGGRVLITTRKDDVSSSFRVENVLRLEPLGYGDAFVLFCNNAFHNKSCPPELKPFAESLVQKCEGLPLAILAIGRLMLGKGDSCLEWKKVEQSLSSQISSNSEFAPLKNILLLSYDDLPYYLQRCFLYCTLFPEDYSIPQKRLIRLWVAEGLVEEHRRLTLEEVAAGYIKELTCRSLLQVDVDHFKVRKCVRMHDVFRELALEIAREEKFCDALVATEKIQNNEARRLSLSNFTGSIPSSSCHLRSLMFFSTKIPLLSLNSIASSIKLLRVLDLQGSSIGSLPDELIELFNLRYLSLRETNVDKLPESIGRFQNLQTLDIRDSKIKTLPKGVEKLKKLRHLYTYHYNGSMGFDFYDFAQAPNGICDLNCLQTLQCIGANNEVIRKVGNLTQLRKLTIRDVKSFHGKELCGSLEKLKSLLMLQVKATRGEEILRLDTLFRFHCPTYLEDLQLSGHLEMLPPGIRSVQSLTKVTLHWSQLNEDPLTLLQELPNLLRLDLTNAYVGKELCIRRGSFLKLELLTFAELPRLNWILIEEKSMSCIRNINLVDCPELKNIPEGIQYLTSLQELWLLKMSGEFLRRIWQDRGVNLQHIPKIIQYTSTSMVLKKEDKV